MKKLYELSENFFSLLDMGDYHSPDKAQVDKLCFQNALTQFLKSGKKDDAFCVYLCFSEIFRLFGTGYANTKKLLETLSDHEYHAGELLSKHRDHYSHSVYVFALGLAFYSDDPAFRRNYLSFYGLEENGRSAFHFLKFWGLVALFHDIGYPFQLAHEQIKSYVEDVLVGEPKDKMDEKEKKEQERKLKTVPYVSYGNLKKFIALDRSVSERLAESFPGEKPFETFHDLLAYGLKVREGYDPEAVRRILTDRVVKQPNFMDHGYFSVMILARQLFSVPDFYFDMEYLDVFTAILLHNNFNKYDAPGKHPIRCDEHPLAYLIILCDELQCWDRIAYGKVSKLDPIAWDISLNISENALTVNYVYDSFDVRNYVDALHPDVRLNKYYAEMCSNSEDPSDCKFVKKIHSCIDTPLRIVVFTEEKKKKRKSDLFASDDDFLSLWDLAKAIHGTYVQHCLSKDNRFFSETFGDLDLETKISNIEQAKSYGYKLELINCFFSRKDLDYPVVEDFNSVDTDYEDNIGFLSREEHVRWVKRQLAMGWDYGIPAGNANKDKEKRIHKDIVPYEMLEPGEREKDELLVKNMLTLLKKMNSGIKIYNYRAGRRPTLEVAGIGHRFFKNDPEELKTKIKETLIKLGEGKHVVVRTCFAYGADQLIAECAAELGYPIKANIPMKVEDYIEYVRKDVQDNRREFTADDERRMRRLLAQTVVCRVLDDKPTFEETGKYYEEASDYIIRKCDILIAVWDCDQKAPANRGGTFDLIQKAEAANKRVITIKCDR